MTTPQEPLWWSPTLGLLYETDTVDEYDDRVRTAAGEIVHLYRVPDVMALIPLDALARAETALVGTLHESVLDELSDPTSLEELAETVAKHCAPRSLGAPD